jgi:hypothetical protein
MERLVEFDPDLAVINAPSLRTTGKRICRELRQKTVDIPIVLIIDAEQPLPSESCANVALVAFTARKLLNRSHRYCQEMKPACCTWVISG